MKSEERTRLGSAQLAHVMLCSVLAMIAWLPGFLLAAPAWASDWLWQHPVPQGETLRAAAVGEGFLIAIGDCGTISRRSSETEAWQPVATPTSKDLKAVAYVSPKTWVASGSGGTILRSTDSGLVWTRVESGSTNDNLFGLAFGAPNAGIAVGSGGTILLTRDGGQSWARQVNEVKATLRGVTFLSAREAVAVGESGVILKTDDAGLSWKQHRVRANLCGVVARGDVVIAVGGEVGYFKNRRVIFRSTHRGDDWKMDVSEFGPVLYGVSLGSDMTAVACGESGALLKRADLDSDWTKMNSPTKHLLAAIVHHEEEVVALGSFGVALTGKDDGKNWTANFSKKQKILNSISFADPNHGVAVGEEGLILYTVDGGGHWQKSRSDFKAYLSGVSMVSPAIGVAVGGEGLVLRTTDGGEFWNAIVAGTDVYLGAVDFADQHGGLAVGYSVIMATDDAGISWVRRPLPAGMGDYWLADVAYASPSVVAIVGSRGIILTSSDGGRTWARRPGGTTQDLQSIAWSDSQHATAVGDKGLILRSADGGLTWVQTPSGTDHRLTGVAYLDSREGFACGQSGTLLYTPDGGRTWLPERSHTQNHLGSLSCRAGTSVFAAGWNATILRQDLSRRVEIP